MNISIQCLLLIITCMQYSQSPEEDIRSLGTGAPDSGCWELSPGRANSTLNHWTISLVPKLGIVYRLEPALSSNPPVLLVTVTFLIPWKLECRKEIFMLEFQSSESCVLNVQSLAIRVSFNLWEASQGNSNSLYCFWRHLDCPEQSLESGFLASILEFWLVYSSCGEHWQLMWHNFF